MKRLDFFTYKNEFSYGYEFALQVVPYGTLSFTKEMYGTGFDIKITLFNYVFGLTVKLTLPKAGDAVE